MEATLKADRFVPVCLARDQHSSGSASYRHGMGELAIERCSTVEAVRALWKQRILPRSGYYSTMDDVREHAEAMCMRLGGLLEENEHEKVVSLTKRMMGERE